MVYKCNNSTIVIIDQITVVLFFYVDLMTCRNAFCNLLRIGGENVLNIYKTIMQKKLQKAK